MICLPLNEIVEITKQYPFFLGSKLNNVYQIYVDPSTKNTYQDKTSLSNDQNVKTVFNFTLYFSDNDENKYPGSIPDIGDIKKTLSAAIMANKGFLGDTDLFVKHSSLEKTELKLYEVYLHILSRYDRPLRYIGAYGDPDLWQFKLIANHSEMGLKTSLEVPLNGTSTTFKHFLRDIKLVKIYDAKNFKDEWDESSVFKFIISVDDIYPGKAENISSTLAKYIIRSNYSLGKSGFKVNPVGVELPQLRSYNFFLRVSRVPNLDLNEPFLRGVRKNFRKLKPLVEKAVSRTILNTTLNSKYFGSDAHWVINTTSDNRDHELTGYALLNVTVYVPSKYRHSIEDIKRTVGHAIKISEYDLGNTGIKIDQDDIFGNSLTTDTRFSIGPLSTTTDKKLTNPPLGANTRVSKLLFKTTKIINNSTQNDNSYVTSHTSVFSRRTTVKKLRSSFLSSSFSTPDTITAKTHDSNGLFKNRGDLLYEGILTKRPFGTQSDKKLSDFVSLRPPVVTYPSSLSSISHTSRPITSPSIRVYNPESRTIVIAPIVNPKIVKNKQGFEISYPSRKIEDKNDVDNYTRFKNIENIDVPGNRLRDDTFKPFDINVNHGVGIKNNEDKDKSYIFERIEGEGSALVDLCRLMSCSYEKICRIVDGHPTCVCKPGFSRKGNGPCFQAKKYTLLVRVLRQNTTYLTYTPDYQNKSSANYKRLSSVADKAMENTIQNTKIYPWYIRGPLVNIENSKRFGQRHFEDTAELVVPILVYDLDIDWSYGGSDIDIRNEIMGALEANDNRLVGTDLYVDPIPFIKDIDECSDPILNDCHQLATCYNTIGSFGCKCLEGYIDNALDDQFNSGRICNAPVSDCSDEHCNYHGICSVDSTLNERICKCEKWWVGRQCQHSGRLIAILGGLALALAALMCCFLPVWICFHKEAKRRRVENIKWAFEGGTNSSGKDTMGISSSSEKGTTTNSSSHIIPSVVIPRARLSEAIKSQISARMKDDNFDDLLPVHWDDSFVNRIPRPALAENSHHKHYNPLQASALVHEDNRSDRSDTQLIDEGSLKGFPKSPIINNAMDNQRKILDERTMSPSNFYSNLDRQTRFRSSDILSKFDPSYRHLNRNNNNSNSTQNQRTSTEKYRAAEAYNCDYAEADYCQDTHISSHRTPNDILKSNEKTTEITEETTTTVEEWTKKYKKFPKKFSPPQQDRKEKDGDELFAKSNFFSNSTTNNTQGNNFVNNYKNFTKARESNGDVNGSSSQLNSRDINVEIDNRGPYNKGYQTGQSNANMVVGGREDEVDYHYDGANNGNRIQDEEDYRDPRFYDVHSRILPRMPNTSLNPNPNNLNNGLSSVPSKQPSISNNHNNDPSINNSNNNNRFKRNDNFNRSSGKKYYYQKGVGIKPAQFYQAKNDNLNSAATTPNALSYTGVKGKVAKRLSYSASDVSSGSFNNEPYSIDKNNVGSSSEIADTRENYYRTEDKDPMKMGHRAADTEERFYFERQASDIQDHGSEGISNFQRIQMARSESNSGDSNKMEEKDDDYVVLDSSNNRDVPKTGKRKISQMTKIAAEASHVCKAWQRSGRLSQTALNSGDGTWNSLKGGIYPEEVASYSEAEGTVRDRKYVPNEFSDSHNNLINYTNPQNIEDKTRFPQFQKTDYYTNQGYQE
ncbi:uncharacterized protein LOC135930098 [Gordionus sp. m RMFG-2023]|uniref:uncharacterized protein LOC135930098 n=1 Tax=Gordionus sp. m RMFG-2023 TaxID=3053472 RepID=UPI0031FC9E0E